MRQLILYCMKVTLALGWTAFLQNTVDLYRACRHRFLFVLSDNTERVCLPGMEESDDDKLAGMPLAKLCHF
jgi:hypothetical protein